MGVAPRRIRLELTGAVQGVGFRPFVHRLATSEGLAGFVRNTGAGVALEIEGSGAALDRFLNRLDAELALPARIEMRRAEAVPPCGEHVFTIVPSTGRAAGAGVVLPDLAPCADCLAEIRDPGNRRHRYPFTTCTRCGPRYSIIEALPYDRERTVMRRFRMCPECQAEYDEPSSRRFHAETNACPACGPGLAFGEDGLACRARGEAALQAAAAALRQGRILALKGLGGFQLLVDARSDAAIGRLRERKHRPAKPFAVLVKDLAAAAALAEIGPLERELLESPAAPIVLVRARLGSLATGIAPGSPLVGLMLPATPLHHLLAEALGFPVVATSGNRGDEPIVIDEAEAADRLAGLAEAFLIHDRPIRRRVDDSVVRIIGGRTTVLRSARGYAPRRLAWEPAREPVLALGGHQKAAIALGGEGRIVLGPHLGDLDTVATREAFLQAPGEMAALHGARTGVVACDAHPDYYGAQAAARFAPEIRRVPHHLAHALAGRVEHGLDGAFLAVAWDGTGFGADGTIWGGEVLLVEDAGWRRAAHLWPFRLPGGEAAMRQPCRSALGVLHAIDGAAALEREALAAVAAFAPPARRVIARMLESGLNAPLTSSAGRLFDAVAALLDLRQIASFEGEAAASVEFAAEFAEPYPLDPAAMIARPGVPLAIDWRPVLRRLIEARRAGVTAGPLAAGFHAALAAAILGVAERLGQSRVLLTGGCFQNARLTELAVHSLRTAGFEPYWHHAVPPNDGGLAVGQAAFAAHPLSEERS